MQGCASLCYDESKKPKDAVSKGGLDMSTLDQDKIYTSKSLQEEMNEERVLEGKEPLPAINPMRGGTGTLARKDRSWKSVPDFFVKAFRKK